MSAAKLSDDDITTEIPQKPKCENKTKKKKKKIYNFEGELKDKNYFNIDTDPKKNICL